MSSDREGAYTNIDMPGDLDEGNYVVEWGQEDLDAPDPDVDIFVCGMFARLYNVAKVEFDLNGPWVAGIFVHDWLGQSTWLSFTYERIGSFCYRCGKWVHMVEGCLAKPREDEGQRTKSRFSFGPWLRALARTSVDESTIDAQLAANLHDGWVNSLVLVAKEIPKSIPLKTAAKCVFLKKLIRTTKMVYHPDLGDIEEKKVINNYGMDYIDMVLYDLPSTSKP
ncbi:hypothetical protein Tsubulata_035716 [Turnera subulata]|uniref:Zinc knuckle CX2CX4HX4C domain-containing protein n=1 Tax=Turnera subulata TaxID=218843 RepID=A0A9Q0JHX4_9ROSI|nr:hypothetical protein Tsubulata_035716 [Turnera subulata]